jgi:hypothetical protein
MTFYTYYICIMELVTTKTENVFDSLPKRIAVSSYDRNVMQLILIDLASTTDPMYKIIDRYGVPEPTVNWWRAVSNDIANAWRMAWRSRADLLADQLHKESDELDQVTDDEVSDPRLMMSKLKKFDIKWRHKEWLMGKMNKFYGDKLAVDNNVTVNNTELRESAWNKYRTISDAEYTNISDVSSSMDKAKAANE